MQFVTSQGRMLKLGSLLGKGGEASVYNVEGARDIVAKIYHSPPSTETQQKLAWMTQVATPELSMFAAWPHETLHRQASGPTAGVLMPRVENASEIHELYGPAHRRTAFPNADWQFLIRTARNCAAAFATLHDKSVVIGDVNQGNLLVTHDALIKMIDCDSFQLRGKGRLFRCTVGVAHFQPPELQSVRFDSVVRTPNHDNFGLAVLIFHLLFMGRHPFSVRPLDREEISIEAAIKASRFPYGKQAKRLRVGTPPHALQLTCVNRQLAEYFETAFSASTTDGGRPTASQWAEALKSFESTLTNCNDDAGHIYFGAINDCPWCRFAHNGGPDFFVSASLARVTTAFSTFDLEKTWSIINSIQSPKQRYQPGPRIAVSSIPPAVLPSQFREEIRFQNLLKIIAAVGLFCSLFGLCYWPILTFTIPTAVLFGVIYLVIVKGSKYGIYKQERKDRLYERRQELATLAKNQRIIGSQGQAEFEEKHQKLAVAYQSYKTLANRFAQAKQNLQEHANDRQLDEWLDRFYVSQAGLSGIGAGRVATLQSYGIETAKDVIHQNVSRIPGFGPVLTSTLVTWRRACESRFRFDPSKGIPKPDLQKLERTFSVERHSLIRLLRNGPEILERIGSRTNDSINNIDTQIAHAEYELAKAEKAFSVCP